jgi:membrane complex biogenesis BtpA family protein
MNPFRHRGGTIVGVIHLPRLLGQVGFPGIDAVVSRAMGEARALARGGVDALLIENWRDESPGPFVGPDTVSCMAVVCSAVAGALELPVGVNVLPNDYRAALALARSCGLAFVQLDVLVDPVRTDYSYSTAPPFEVRVDRSDLAATRARLGAEEVALLGTVHPKHYALLLDRSIEASATDALAWGAQAVVVTGARTGSAPDVERILRVKRAVGEAPVVVGSGLDAGNASALMAHADAAIVGTAFKTPDLERVVPAQVESVVAAIRAATRRA